MLAGLLFTIWSAQHRGGGQSAYMFMGIVATAVSAVWGVFWGMANYRFQRDQDTTAEQQRVTAYRAYIERQRAVLTRRTQENCAVLGYQYQETVECLRWSHQGHHRLWERNASHQDFLTVRLGLGGIPSPIPISVPKERFSLVQDELAHLPNALRATFRIMEQAPVTVSLRENPLTGVIARSEEDMLDVARNLCVQLSVTHCYTDVKLVILHQASHRQMWNFARFLPHIWFSGMRMIACDETGAGEVLYALSIALRRRLMVADNPEGAQDAATHPHFVVLIEDASLVQDDPILKYLLNPTPEMGLSTALLYEKLDRLPSSCTAILENGSDFCGFYSIDSSFEGIGGIRFDKAELGAVERYARRLSRFRVREFQSAGAVPESISFLELYGVLEATAFSFTPENLTPPVVVPPKVVEVTNT